MHAIHANIHSIRTKFTLLTLGAVLVTLSIATVIAMISIVKLGRKDAEQMIHLTCTTGALNLESYFNSVENSVEMVSKLVQESLEDMPDEDLESHVERTRSLFGNVARNTNGVLTYYYRIDPDFSTAVPGFWYVKQGEGEFLEHEVTDIRTYDTRDTSALVWFTVPKATGRSAWLPPYTTENLAVRVLSYNVPVIWKERFVGVIGIEIDYGTLEREVGNLRVFETGYAFVLDADSKVICHPRTDSVTVEKEKEAIAAMDRESEEDHIRYSFEGMEKEAVWVPLSNGMRLVVTASVSEIDSVWKGMIRNLIFASLVILVAVGVVTMRFTGRLTRPLHELTLAARKADQGDYKFELEYDSDDEVGVLMHTFKEMAAHTQHHISDLSEKAYVDALTGAGNKRGYSSCIQQLQDRIDDPVESPRFAFGVFDCDNLKQINDSHGHDKGDAYLKNASSLIRQVFEPSPVFRIGGDEFAVILQNEDLANREQLVRRFRESAAQVNENARAPWEKVCVAVGIAVYDPQRDTFAIDVARRADQQMYENKRQRKETRKPDKRNARGAGTKGRGRAHG